MYINFDQKKNVPYKGLGKGGGGGRKARANIVGGAIVDTGLELVFQLSNLGICHF